MKKLLFAALLLTGCATTTPEVPQSTTRIAFSDTTENGILCLDLDYPTAMFGGNGNQTATNEINRLIFLDTLDAPLLRHIDRYTTANTNYDLNLHGRFTEGQGIYVSYVLTDSVSIIRSRVFSTMDGHPATLDEVCEGDFTEILCEQLNAHKADCPASYTITPLPLSENWTVNGFGITFHYSAGEVAPTTASITVPWSDFR